MYHNLDFKYELAAQSENIKRIAKNTAVALYRMLFGMLMSLYTSRVILIVG